MQQGILVSMRLFLFYTFLLALPLQPSLAQDVTPGTPPPSAEDLNTLPPEGEEDSSGASRAPDAQADEKPLDSLYRDLAAAKSDSDAAPIARKIQRAHLESGSDTVNLLMERAAIALRAEDYGLALDLMDVVLRLKPDFAEAWNRRATIYYVKREYGRSLADIEHVLALEPRHWGALSGLAIIQRQLEQKEKALATFRRVAEIHPGLDSARKAIEELETELAGEPI
ncbi:tetratricopeptide repeat protein [Pannonibacter phragmitetus]|uniref:tetratricopeptide repeat protein n=1 Tax=Pannonibacter phragmitetus TaxID=121719 RepID=UPI003D2ED52B